MKPIITIIPKDRQKEANYICFLAKNITRNLYQEGGFIVLPRPLKHEKSVYFPDLHYSTRFWNLISKAKLIDFGDQFPLTVINEIIDKAPSTSRSGFTAKRDKLPTTTELEQTNFDFTKLWNTSMRYFGNSVKFNKIRSIEIQKTDYGTSGSWDIKYSSRGISINLTWRSDLPTSVVKRTILLALYTIVAGQKAEIGEDYWFQRRAVVEFLLRYSEFSSGYKALPQTTQLDILKESDEYLNKLGFPNKPCIIIKNGKLHAKNYNLEALLSKQEYGILLLLFQNSGTLITFDTIADVLWNETLDEKFSLYAIAKVIENIRKKIRLLGVNKEVVITVRGKGYVVR